MNEETKGVLELAIGLLVCQGLVIDALVKEGILKKEHIELRLKPMIKTIDKRKPNNKITQSMKSIVDSLNIDAPLFFSDFLRELEDNKS